VPYAEVASYAAAGDIAVLPGVLDFGNSMKLFEYMALGKAVVAPDLKAIRDVACDREQVCLFHDGDAAALRAALQALIEDRGLCRRLGTAAAALARTQTWDARAESLVAALHRLGITAA
jgi:glycosyltransferase involved in cell wall biosynthesis